MMTLHNIFWFVLVGWVAGWVTGRSVKNTGYGAYGDALLGVLGGLGGGWLMRHTGLHYHWGFLFQMIVCAAGAVGVTWLVRSVIQRQHGPRQHAHV